MKKPSRVCDICDRPALAMPVRYAVQGYRFETRECLACRLDFDRQQNAQGHTHRIEGRHGRPGATALPCSLQRLSSRAPIHG